MKIVPLATEHAADAARLHIAGQPGTFLTSLGSDVLTLIYKALPASAGGFGFAACDLSEQGGQSRIQPAGTMYGFVSATTSMGQLMAEMGTRHALRFAPLLLRRFIRQPQLLLPTAQTALYPLLAHSRSETPTTIDSEQPISGATAELLSIMVEPNQRGNGIGHELVTHLCQRCREQAISALDVTVDVENQGAHRFYERHGFVHQHDFPIFGRMMSAYRLIL